MEFINIGAVYIRGWVGEAQGWVGGGKTLIKEERRHKYRIAGKFGWGKIWRIDSFRACGKINFGKLLDQPIDY